MTIKSAIQLLIVGGLTVTAATLIASDATREGQNEEHWVGTWSTAVHSPSPGAGMTNAGFENQTLRQIVHTSVGGRQVRVRLSTFGAGGLLIGAAHIALRATGAAIVSGSDRTLTFSGKPSITIPPGAPVLSDPVDLNVPALADLAVSIFVPENTGSATWHSQARQTSYVSPSGDFTASGVMAVASTTQSWFWLAGVDVMASTRTGAIVVLGDSITDGNMSTAESNNRWPDHLARRLMDRPGNHAGVLNAGIAGNKLLHDVIGPNALARFDRDVLTQAAVTHVIALLGNNDFLFVFNPAETVSEDQVIEGHRQLIERAHTRGLKIYGGTLTPFEGFAPFSTPANEVKRQAVNAWIRAVGEYDAVIDFDEVLRDPASPARLRAVYDSGDHLHPNDLGYKAMADAIDWRLFKNRERRWQGSCGI